MKTIEYMHSGEMKSAQVNVAMAFREAAERGGYDHWLLRYVRTPDGVMVRIEGLHRNNDHDYVYRASDGMTYTATGDETVYALLDTVEKLDNQYADKRAKYVAMMERFAIREDTQP